LSAAQGILVRQITTWLSVIRGAKYAYWNEPMTDAERLNSWRYSQRGVESIQLIEQSGRLRFTVSLAV